MSNNSQSTKFYKGIHQETFYSREDIAENISEDYIRGLIEGEGHFGLDKRQVGNDLPVFVLKMHVRDKELIEAVCDYLDIPHRVYEYNIDGRHFAMLIIRDVSTLKNKIVPLCRDKLFGHKGTQFAWWLDRFPFLRGFVRK